MAYTKVLDEVYNLIFVVTDSMYPILVFLDVNAKQFSEKSALWFKKIRIYL